MMRTMCTNIKLKAQTPWTFFLLSLVYVSCILRLHEKVGEYLFLLGSVKKDLWGLSLVFAMSKKVSAKRMLRSQADLMRAFSALSRSSIGSAKSARVPKLLGAIELKPI
jgi:hypothetical protein